MNKYDLLITDVRLVRPDEEVRSADIAVADGRFVEIADRLDPAEAAEVLDGAVG